MHGHGYTQPVKQPPHMGWLVFLRVLFVVIAIFSVGLLAWTMLLRLAIVTRKPLDWGLFVAALVADILALVLIGTEPGEDVHTAGGWTGMLLLLGTLVAGIAYYLAADIRHFHRLRHGGHPPRTAPAYGYPQPAPPTPYTATTLPQTSRAPYSPPPQRPAPARIDEVRAELDELSDYLRNHDGRPHGNPEGGR
ncbi:hypothetical protein [Streptomyces lincolnensis]|uniref:hypothetical protein n=1 Tax=Streptomyces lincolnensis TaxID=1915 RepID=UPI0037D7C4AB